MKIYRQIPKIAAISFDLDDTLYDNVPIINRAEAELIHWLSQQFPQQAEAAQSHFWRQCKHQVIKQNSTLANDVTQCRKAALDFGFASLGVQDDTERAALVESGMQTFMHWRNQILVSTQVETLLADLSKQLPLVVITNGNADISQLPIAQYFTAIYAANTQHPMKPSPAMYYTASKQLGITPEELLHIGDSTSSDILGARNANSPSVWFNPTEQALDARILPDVEINDLEELRFFIT